MKLIVCCCCRCDDDGCDNDDDNDGARCCCDETGDELLLFAESCFIKQYSTCTSNAINVIENETKNILLKMILKLFQPFRMRNVLIRNRIWMSPMCMYSAAEDGKANDFHFTHLVLCFVVVDCLWLFVCYYYLLID